MWYVGDGAVREVGLPFTTKTDETDKIIQRAAEFQGTPLLIKLLWQLIKVHYCLPDPLAETKLFVSSSHSTTVNAKC